MSFTKSTVKDEWWGYYYTCQTCKRTFMLDDANAIPAHCPFSHQGGGT